MIFGVWYSTGAFWDFVGVFADIAQLVERVHGKDEVASSILAVGSRFFWKTFWAGTEAVNRGRL